MTSFWESHGTQISMDSRGRALDNLFTERLWRSVIWEEVNLNEYATVLEPRKRIRNDMEFCNYERKHQSLNYKTTAEIYFGKEENLT